MEELKSAYGKANDVIKEIEEKIAYLKKDTNVRLFISLDEELKRLYDEKERLWASIEYQRYSDCNHIIVYTNLDYDHKNGGFGRNCACIKCGLDTSVLAKDINSLNPNEKIMYSYLKGNGIKNSIITGIPCDLKLSMSIYRELIETNPSITDEEIIKVLKSYLVPNNNILNEDNRRLSRVKRE